MNRRHFLAGVGSTCFVSTSGCLNAPGLHSSNNDTNIVRRVSLADQSTISDKYEIAIEIELLENTITDSHTAKLRLVATNLGPTRLLSISTGKCHPFNRGRGGSDEPEGLWLYREEGARNEDRKGDQWVLDRSPEEGRGSANYGCGPLKYESEESNEYIYEIWHDYMTEGYFNPDTYQWEKNISIWEDTNSSYGDDANMSFEWGFSLEVTDSDK